MIRWSVRGIAAGYTTLGILWILLTNAWAARLSSHPVSFVLIQNYKGLIYVTVTGVVLYLLLQNHTSRLEREERARVVSEERYRTFVQQSTEGIGRFELTHPLPLEQPIREQVEHLWRHAYLAECNDALARMYGRVQAADLVDACLSDFFSPLEPAHDRLLRAFMRSRCQLTNIDVQKTDPAGRPRFYLTNLVGIVESGCLTCVWITQRDITDLRCAQEQARRQFERLTALRAIDTAILGSLDLRLTLDIIIDQVLELLNVHAAAILRLNARTQILEYATGRGFRTRAIMRSRLRLGEGYAGRAALERCHVNIPDLQQAAGYFTRAELLTGEDFVEYYAVPLIAKGEVEGVLEVYHRGALSTDPDWLEYLEALAGQAAIAINNATLFSDLQISNAELMLAYDATLEGWSKALDLRDKDTEGHTQRVTEMTLRLARAMGMTEEEIVHVCRGALLHDIGKLGIPDSILLKAGPLTEEEWTIMKRHPVYAYEWLSPISFLRPALDIPYCHHEKWDGTGYPRGLKGEQIPLAARIFAVVDIWDALRSDRPYRPGWPEEKVLEHLQSLAGSHLDPAVVCAFLQIRAEGRER